MPADYANNLFLLAEAVRFELTNGCPLPVFKTGAIDHSATLPEACEYSGAAATLSVRMPDVLALP